ncbi:MAG: hypothetical protein AAGI27_00650 [Pseudomonadota bacterium]
MTDDELIEAVNQIRDTMINVATGGDRIQNVNDEFRELYGRVAASLARKRIENPLLYGDLWDWYHRWSSGDMPTYQSRRLYVNDLCGPLIERVRHGDVDNFVPTGWARVDRTVGELRDRLASAETEEQFQAVGLLGREVLISVAQAVYDPTLHTTSDGVEPSATDTNRMLEAYFATELGGRNHEDARRHARSALQLAVALQHRRTAQFRDAAMCLEATTAVTNIVAIVSGRRDPEN